VCRRVGEGSDLIEGDEVSKRRGDDIPTVADYAHYNEDAYAMWFEENRYDMEHADEEVMDEDEYFDEDGEE
jgi:hypothetical protein